MGITLLKLAFVYYRNEYGLLLCCRLCKHTNILMLRAVCLFVEPSYLVLDLMRCCYLDLLREGSLSPKDILNHITQVVAGVEYLHHLDIIHCDIAARNVSTLLI
jgi:serine/threonine protein kinase